MTVKLFKLLFSMFMTAIMLCACASHPPSLYRPATNAGFGYKEKKLGENYYRVEFKLSGGTKKAQDYALRRSAELTIAEGYDWFIVFKRETLADREKNLASPHFNSRPVVTRNCGLLGCRDNVQTVPNFNIDDDSTSDDVTAVLEIKLGKGIRPASDNSYDAHEINEKLQAQY